MRALFQSDSPPTIGLLRTVNMSGASNVGAEQNRQSITPHATSRLVDLRHSSPTRDNSARTIFDIARPNFCVEELTP